MDESVKLRGYEGPIRQLAVDGLGREKPTLFLSNQFQETARSLIIRYAGRNRVEDGENYSIGFTTVVDGLYPEIIRAAKTASGEMYTRRSRP